MTKVVSDEICAEMMKVYPEKFVGENAIFSRIHRGDRIFIHTACAEPQYLVQALIKFVESHACCQCVSHRLKYRRPEPGTMIWE